MRDDMCVKIDQDVDIVVARQKGRSLAAAMGFSATDQTLIALAISEVTRNIISYAGSGTLTFNERHECGHEGLMIVAQDHGPGIADIQLAMRDGYSTGNSLGLGLPGAKRVMDEFALTSSPSSGTTVTMTKWRR